MQMFGNLNMPVLVNQLEDTTNITGCDQHYDKGMTVVSCKRHDTNGDYIEMYIGTDVYFWELQANAEILAARKFLNRN